MKHLISLFLYHIGDTISRTTMAWFNGFGYSIYRYTMLWSCDLDTDGRIWKHVKPKTNNKSKKKKK